MIRPATARWSLALFVLPALAIYLAFAVLPLATSIVMSLFDTTRTAARLRRHCQLHLPLHPTGGQRALLERASATTPSTSPSTSSSKCRSACCWRRLLTSGALRRSEGIYRTLLFIPATLSVVIVGFIWRLIINPLWGMVGFPLLGNELDRAAHHLADGRLAVFRHPDGVPLFGADRDPQRSGRGGAHRWRQRRGRPSGTSSSRWSLPQFGLIVILTFIWTFNGFDLVFALNGSAPGPNYSHRHPRHAVLPHLLRLERAGRRSRSRRDRRDRHLHPDAVRHRRLFLAGAAPAQGASGLAMADHRCRSDCRRSQARQQAARGRSSASACTSS